MYIFGEGVGDKGDRGGEGGACIYVVYTLETILQKQILTGGALVWL
jgi:hypothetical protein